MHKAWQGTLNGKEACDSGEDEYNRTNIILFRKDLCAVKDV